MSYETINRMAGRHSQLTRHIEGLRQALYVIKQKLAGAEWLDSHELTPATVQMTINTYTATAVISPQHAVDIFEMDLEQSEAELKELDIKFAAMVGLYRPAPQPPETAPASA